MECHFILYVQDQQASAKFYSSVLARTPDMDVPGVTEFRIGTDATLGLMPVAGIRRLLGANLPDPARGQGIPRAELYLRVSRALQYHMRALLAGARELSPLQLRDWGERVGYVLDPDGHVLAFAEAG